MSDKYQPLLYSFYSIGLSLDGHLYALFRRGEEEMYINVSHKIEKITFEAIDALKSACKHINPSSCEELEQAINQIKL